MKYRIAICGTVIALLMALAGCSYGGMRRTLDAAEDRVEEKLDAAEEKLGKAMSLPVHAAAADMIAAEEAVQIALDYLGFTADQVQRLRSELETDDGVRQYDVQFHSGKMEYEFEINAETGKSFVRQRSRL